MSRVRLLQIVSQNHGFLKKKTNALYKYKVEHKINARFETTKNETRRETVVRERIYCARLYFLRKMQRLKNDFIVWFTKCFVVRLTRSLAAVREAQEEDKKKNRLQTIDQPASRQYARTPCGGEHLKKRYMHTIGRRNDSVFRRRSVERRT